TFRSVTLPLARPGLFAGWLLVFVPALQELSASVLLFSSGSITLAVAGYNLYETGALGPVAALAIVTMLIITGAILLATRPGRPADGAGGRRAGGRRGPGSRKDGRERPVRIVGRRRAAPRVRRVHARQEPPRARREAKGHAPAGSGRHRAARRPRRGGRGARGWAAAGAPPRAGGQPRARPVPERPAPPGRG